MTIATKSGGLILKDGKLATNCACCQIIPCGCSLAVFQQLQNLVIQLSFSGFSYAGRLGTSAGNLCDCDTQYGFSGFDMNNQTAFHNDWSSHFNALTADLVFFSATATNIIWRGSTSASTPGGGNATYYFFAVQQCSGSLLIARDSSNGCQSNSSFAALTAADFSQPPLAFAPNISVQNFFGGTPLVSCGQFTIRSFYSGLANTQVFCGGTGPLGCVEANGCGGNYFRASFNGNMSANVAINPLP
jgi:hypothetical protein